MLIRETGIWRLGAGVFVNGKVEAMRRSKVTGFTREQEQAAARRRAARNEPGGLSELLNALAQGLAGIGLPGGGGRKQPARPAF